MNREDPSRAAIPTCCGVEMVVVNFGRRANFAIWIWRCRGCERFEVTNRRYDGQTFWVGAMGKALDDEMHRLIAEAYGG